MEAELISSLDDLNGRKLERKERFFYLNPVSGLLNLATVTGGGLYGSTAAFSIFEDIAHPSAFKPDSESSGWGSLSFEVPQGPPRRGDQRSFEPMTIGSPEAQQSGRNYSLEAESDHFDIESGDARVYVGRTLPNSQPRSAEMSGIGSVRFDATAKLDVRKQSRTSSSHAAAKARRLAIIKEVAPIAYSLADELYEAIEAGQPNNLETLDALRDLRDALSDLIERAQAGKPVEGALKIVRERESHLSRVLAEAGAITRRLGETSVLAIVLSMLWRTPVDSTLVAGVLGAVVASEAIRRGGNG